MFFRLTQINNLSLPTSYSVGSHLYQVTGAELLLEPPGLMFSPSGKEGYSILHFFGRINENEPAMYVGGTREGYSRSSTGEIVIRRGHEDVGVSLEGALEETQLVLTATRGRGFLPDDTLLRFIPCPTEAIPEEWRRAFYYGPPFVRLADGAPPTPEIQAQLERDIESFDRAARREAELRIKEAWSAPT